MSIVTISRKAGSLGDEIARAVADKLGYGYIEKSKISEVLSDEGFSIPDIEKYDEKKPSVWQSISIQKKRFSHLIRSAIYELAARENVVIVGRGGQAIFRDLPGTLHVRIIAPYSTRAARLMEQEGCDEKNAERIIRRKDRDSSGFLSAYFDIDWDDQDLYDLLINTKTMSLETCVETIVLAAGADEFKKSSQKDRKFHDLAIIQEAEAELAGIPGLEISHIEVEKDVVVLSGSAKSSAAKDECEKLLLNIKGISKVDNQLTVIERKRPRIV